LAGERSDLPAEISGLNGLVKYIRGKLRP
jgi:hypothetical protein